MPESVLCRMAETAAGRFYVEIFGTDDKLVAESSGSLDLKSALAFVDREVNRDQFSTHFHWEKTGRTPTTRGVGRLLRMTQVAAH
jgi:hypothetical protein